MRSRHSRRTLPTQHSAVRLRFRCCDRRADHRDPFGAKERVEGFGQFDVAVPDHNPRLSALVAEGREQVPRLVCDPGAVGMGGDAGDVHAPPLQFDEEEDIQATQPHLDVRCNRLVGRCLRDQRGCCLE
jgi:hypothetical protein